MFKKIRNDKPVYIRKVNTDSSAEESAKTKDELADKIFVRGHLTDLEKLLFAENEIKELKKKVKELELRLGKQQSDLDEAEFLIRKYKPLSKQEEKAEIAKDEYVQNLKRSMNALMKSNKNLTIEKNVLLAKLVAYKDK